RQRFGESLEEVVRGLMKGLARVAAATEASTGAEEWGPIHAFVTEMKAAGGLTGRMTRAVDRRDDDRRDDGPNSPLTPDHAAAAAPGRDVIVAASGNLALISFPAVPARLTVESLD